VASSRHALFDLAVNRAAEVAARLGGAARHDLRHALEVWYLKTRFASRVPFEAVLDAVRRRPSAAAHWEGGPRGGWRPGPPPVP
jgi:hypothetical protein